MTHMDREKMRRASSVRRRDCVVTIVDYCNLGKSAGIESGLNTCWG